jgi:hypothetical protein
MAIFHCDVKTISRAKGRSSTAAAAYRAGERIEDERTGEVFDYTRRRGVEHTELVLPVGAPDMAQDRSSLWNAAEAAENRKNSCVAREVVVALPHELDAGQRAELVRGFAAWLVERHGVAVDLAIHAPHRSGDERNHHAHLLLTTRRLEAEGLGAKTRELDEKRTGGEHVTAWREQWAQEVNRSLERAGVAERVDCRSHAARGEDREALLHLGPEATGMERRGEASRIGEENRQREERNRDRPSRGSEREAEAGPPTREQVTALWRGADSGAAFVAALEAEGLTLCRGERRPFVVVDEQGKTHNLARLVEGVKTEALRERLAGLALPTVDAVRAAGVASVAELEKPRHDAAEAQQQPKRQGEALAALERQGPTRSLFLAEATAAATRARAERGEREREDAARARRGDITDAGSRYAQALADEYRIDKPYASLARAAVAEYARFAQQQGDLARQIAEAKTPEGRRSLELRREIESCEYMAVTSNRLAVMGRVLAGGKDSEQSRRDDVAAKAYQAKAEELRTERAGPVRGAGRSLIEMGQQRAAERESTLARAKREAAAARRSLADEVKDEVTRGTSRDGGRGGGRGGGASR